MKFFTESRWLRETPMHGFCFIPNHEYGWLWSFIVIACLAMACKDLYDLTVSFYQEPVSTTISLNYPLDKRKVNTKIPNITICAEIQPSFNLYTYYIAKLEYENTTLSDDLDKLIEESQNITNITFNILTYHDFEPIIGQIRILLWFVNNFELSASYLEKIPLSGSKLSDYVHDSPPATDPTYPIIPGYPLSLFDEDYRNQIFKPLWREIKSRNITITQITKFLGSYVCKKQLSEYAVTAESFDGYRQNNQTVDHCSQNLVKYLDLYQVCFEIPIDLKSNSIIMTASSAKLTALVSGEPFDTLTLGSSKLPISMEQGQVKAVVQLQGQHMAYNCPSRPCLSGENLVKHVSYAKLAAESCGCWPSSIIPEIPSGYQSCDKLYDDVSPNFDDIFKSDLDKYGMKFSQKIAEQFANKSRYQFSQKCKPLEVIDPISPCESKIIGAKVSQQINSDREKSIVISLENTPYFIFHESPIMSTTSYISSFGGSIGVWLGASFMAFFHVFVSVFATVFGCGKQWMGKRKTKVSQEASKKAEVYDEPEPTTLTIH